MKTKSTPKGKQISALTSARVTLPINYHNEALYKKALCGTLRAQGFHVQCHEDRVSNFIPDISIGGAGSDGWIEVKYTHLMPGCLDMIKHFTKGQEDWLRKRGAIGSGHCYLVLGTPVAHFLYRWDEFPDARYNYIHTAAGHMTISGLVRELALLFRQRP